MPGGLHKGDITGLDAVEHRVARRGDAHEVVVGGGRVGHGEARGRARIYARVACGTLIGAELLGPRAEHLAHLLSWSIQRGQTVQDTLAMPFYHPVIEEGRRTALSRAARALKLAAAPEPIEGGPGA